MRRGRDGDYRAAGPRRLAGESLNGLGEAALATEASGQIIFANLTARRLYRFLGEDLALLRRLDRGSVWRSVGMRRGLMVLGLGPALVATVTVSPRLAASFRSIAEQLHTLAFGRRAHIAGRDLIGSMVMKAAEDRQLKEYTNGAISDGYIKNPGNPTYKNDLGFIWADHDQNRRELARHHIAEARSQLERGEDESHRRAAANSVRALAELEPTVLASGHGRPMVGAETALALRAFAKLLRERRVGGFRS